MRIILFLIIFVVHCYAKHTPKGVSIDSDAGVVSVDDYLLNCVESGNTLEEVSPLFLASGSFPNSNPISNPMLGPRSENEAGQEEKQG